MTKVELKGRVLYAKTSSGIDLPLLCTVSGSYGVLQVEVSSLPLPTGAATEATLLSIATNTSALDSALAVHNDTYNVGTTEYSPIGGVFDDSYTAASGSPRLLPLRISNNGAAHVNLRTNAGAEISPALESGGNLAAAATSLALIDDWDNAASDGASVSGDTAHDAVDAGEPVKIGGKVNTGNAPTAVANADRVNAWFDEYGRIKVAGSIDDGTTLTAINTTYDDSPTSANSADLTVPPWAKWMRVVGTVSKSGTVTSITFTIQNKRGSSYFPCTLGFAGKWIYSNAALASSQDFDVYYFVGGMATVRLRAVAAGTDVTNTITCASFEAIFSS